MKRTIAFLLCVVILLGMCGCGLLENLTKPTFEDFAHYEYAFATAKKFMFDYYSTHNEGSPIAINIAALLDPTNLSEHPALEALEVIYNKGFEYVEVCSDYIVFWSNEYCRYGVLWTLNYKEYIMHKTLEVLPYFGDITIGILSTDWYELSIKYELKL